MLSLGLVCCRASIEFLESVCMTVSLLWFSRACIKALQIAANEVKRVRKWESKKEECVKDVNGEVLSERE